MWRDILDVVARGRRAFSLRQWRDLLLRSIGFEPAELSERAQDVLLLRMVPFVERNYNLVELGPRGTGKSHLYQQVSPYAHLVSGGKATVAKMFVDNATGRRGLVAQHDVVCFDEVHGIDFDRRSVTDNQVNAWHSDERQARLGCNLTGASAPNTPTQY